MRPSAKDAKRLSEGARDRALGQRVGDASSSGAGSGSCPDRTWRQIPCLDVLPLAASPRCAHRPPTLTNNSLTSSARPVSFAAKVGGAPSSRAFCELKVGGRPSSRPLAYWKVGEKSAGRSLSFWKVHGSAIREAPSVAKMGATSVGFGPMRGIRRARGRGRCLVVRAQDEKAYGAPTLADAS